MKLIGVDIDGTLLPLKGKRDNLAGIRGALVREYQHGSRMILITSRQDPQEAQRQLLRQFDINLECVATSRDWPSMKGEYLRQEMYRNEAIDIIELWDDEEWYLNPASRLGVKCAKVIDGRLVDYYCSEQYVEWVPKSPVPTQRVYGKL